MKEGGADQQVDDGADDDGPKAACKGVGYEGSDERCEAGGATKIGEGVGCLNKREVQHLCEVCDHVGMKTSTRESVAYFICCQHEQDAFVRSQFASVTFVAID